VKTCELLTETDTRETLY